MMIKGKTKAKLFDYSAFYKLVVDVVRNGCPISQNFGAAYTSGSILRFDFRYLAESLPIRLEKYPEPPNIPIDTKHQPSKRPKSRTMADKLMGFVYNSIYGLISESGWMFVGGMVGFFAPFLTVWFFGPWIRTLLDKPKFTGLRGPKVIITTLPLFTVPVCAGISLMAALSTQGWKNRVTTLLLTNELDVV
eukprot:jgi/Bigna1/127591/aug1.4_g2299